MVKNFGGKKTKSVARKAQFANTSFDIRLRMSTCPEEKYAVVRKLFGNSCCVFCDDYKERLVMISGKFSRRNNKRNNFISPGSVILVGLRDWATVIDGKTEKCDLLEVYSPLELDQLKQKPNFPTHFIDSISNNDSIPNNPIPNDSCIFSSIDLIHNSFDHSTLSNSFDTGLLINLDDI